MKRRIFALLAALCLLAGCAGKTEPDAPVVDPAPPTVDPTPVTPTEPSEAEQAEARLRERIAGMSIEEKVGQMFFIRCPETGAAEDVAAYHLGGLLLFGRDERTLCGEFQFLFHTVPFHITSPAAARRSTPPTMRFGLRTYCLP